MADTESLIAGAENYISSLTDDEFADLVTRTREPAEEEKPGQSKAPATGSVAKGAERFASRRAGK